MGPKQKPKLYTLYSRHVSGALTPEKLDFYRKYPSLAQKRFTSYDPAFFQDVSTGFVRGTNVLKWVEQELLLNMSVYPPSFSRDWPLIWETTRESLRMQIDHLTKDLSHEDMEEHLSMYRELGNHPRMRLAGARKAHILNLHNDITSQAERGDFSFRLTHFPDIELLGELVLLHKFPGGGLWITYQMFVNVLDKIEAEFSWLFYLLFLERLPSHSSLQPLHLFDSIYRVLEDAYETEGNEAIRLFKLMEPTMVGLVLQKLPEATNDHSFLGEIKISLQAKNPALACYHNRIIAIGKDYLATHGVDGINTLMEQVGQEKLHFYPIVNIEGGLKKMFEHGTSLRPLKEGAPERLAASFKREYFVAFYEKHKILPKTLKKVCVDKRIRSLLEQGKPGSIRECYRIPNSAWGSLHFEQNHSFNYYPQISDLLDDKAITPPASNMTQLYAEDALAVIHQRKPLRRCNTRLILEILHREEVDIKRMYEQLEREGRVPNEWALIQLMSKERELKIEPRVFSILTFECRMIAFCCERNLGEQILVLFKQQTMTLSGSQLKEKLHLLSTLPETGDSTWVTFHMDLEQWNYTFRSYQQVYFLRVLDTLFRVNHYRYLTQIFTDSLLISANKYTPPGMPDEFTDWDTHAGGNQGILQKLWTIITIITIRDVMHEKDLEHRLTGSGDNQVLFVKFRKTDALSLEIQDVKTMSYGCYAPSYGYNM